MIDAFVADKVYPTSDGIRAQIGPLSLLVQSPSRDAEKISTKDNPVIFTVLEIEGERISTPVLVGLATERRRSLYKILRGLKGIGRRSALMVLDTGETIDILRSVAGKDPSLFRTVPGLGAKRIEAIFETLEAAYEGSLPKPLPLSLTVWVEVRDALCQNGCSEEEAERLIHSSSLQQDGEKLLKEIISEL
jgi:Holliday junction resolvasome RuvABC DNA-binding subunit